MRLNNLLLNKPRVFSFNQNSERSYRVRLIPGDPLMQSVHPVSMTLGIGDSPAGLWLSSWPMIDSIREFIPEGMLARLPENLGIAIAENALESLVTVAEHAIGNKLKIQSLSAEQNSKVYTLPLGFEIYETNKNLPENDQTQQITGLLVVEERLYPLLQERLRFWPSDMNDEWEALDTSVRLEIDQISLPIQDVNNLQPADILLLEQTQFHKNGSLKLRFHNHLYCEAQLTDKDKPAFTIQSEWNTMPEEKPNTATDQINQIPVQLSFDLGQKTMSFSEARQLRPGYVVDLPGSLPEVVQIRAHNKVIGSGELVEINGRIGVRILNLFNAKK